MAEEEVLQQSGKFFWKIGHLADLILNLFFILLDISPLESPFQKSMP
jgi:hypothetical protein